MSPRKDGAFVRLPVIDTDPNSGLTFGIMPVWVRTAENGNLRRIHMAMLTYNRYFGVTGSYEQFYFPEPKTNVQLFASYSQHVNRDATAEYRGSDLIGRGIDAYARVQYDRDGSQRFYGFGPKTQKTGESDYTLDTINYRFLIGLPLDRTDDWKLNFSHHLESNAVGAGAVKSVPDLKVAYPDVAGSVAGSERNAYFETSLSYDTRDSAQTTSRGLYGMAFIQGSNQALISEFDYYRYGADLRGFLPVTFGDETEPRFVTAGRYYFEQLNGAAPFWALPQLGGKYTLRAYGDGRFTDHGMTMMSLEQRCRVYDRRMAGTTASFWVDPFFGLGTVFPKPEEMQARYFHPAYGLALRAVARPQVVGSLDLGFGQEGMKVFLDINYSF